MERSPSLLGNSSCKVQVSSSQVIIVRLEDRAIASSTTSDRLPLKL
ncbi:MULTISPECIES: hypothetical protein [Nostoc]|uniref:Uncharacterized protein n=2 Tax=Nostoc TaxID=1177 RepID=A0ABR8ICC6_9NOSO|nr:MULTISPECIES: hypothetical protein [Nostoc]MBD2562387.1 hypothetical protein [Nostoc linckia FACHB-391]MBD2648944.1 hypothetical protein [Nostoc foliaceum FACHB-393]